MIVYIITDALVKGVTAAQAGNVTTHHRIRAAAPVMTVITIINAIVCNLIQTEMAS
jgi:hypothetical protein